MPKRPVRLRMPPNLMRHLPQKVVVATVSRLIVTTTLHDQVLTVDQSIPRVMVVRGR